jgi:hypothetical protein
MAAPVERKIREVRTFILLLLLVPAALAAAESEFHNTTCGVRFQYPASWTARVLPRTADSLLRCTVAIDPPDWAQTLDRDAFAVEEHAIYVKVYSAAFPDVAVKGKFYLFDDGKWRIVGRGNDFPKTIQTPCCFGLYGKLTYGRFRKGGTGGYQGLGEYDHAILATAHISIIASAPGGHSAVFRRVLDTLRVR